MDRTERAVVLQWFYLTMNPVPIGYLGANKRKRHRVLETRDGQCGEMMEGGNVFLDGRPLGVSERELRSLEPGVLTSSETEQGLARYLAAKVYGQRFLQAGSQILSLREAIPRWLLAYPAILFTSRAIAASLGKTAVEAEDVLKAVRAVDRGVGRVSIERLKKPQREAWQFVLGETDAPIAAAVELLSRGTV